VHWEWAGRVFDQQLPAWARGAIPGVQAPWAPDVTYFNDRYHLYYSLSTFGSQRSAIGLAVNPTLDPHEPGYEWVDQGMVIESWPGRSDHNAIDPTVAFDENGEPWMAWGSWSGGLRIRKLDTATGMLSARDTTQYPIATRLQRDNAIEGPFIIRHDGYFYLFVSYDLCCRGVESTYNVRVGRSRQIHGPYHDHAGVPMMQGGGTPVLSGYGRVRGPGHGSVLEEGGQHYLVHHFYDAADGGTPTLQIRPLLWGSDGWPLAGDPFDGTPPAPPPADVSLAARWGYGREGAAPVRIQLHADGRLQHCGGEGTWSFESPELVLHWNPTRPGGSGRRETAIVSATGDGFVGRADDGAMIRAYRLAGQ
jgi:arabinan endo-1,5-alpha-L-arabinosidase